MLRGCRQVWFSPYQAVRRPGPKGAAACQDPQPTEPGSGSHRFTQLQVLLGDPPLHPSRCPLPPARRGLHFFREVSLWSFLRCLCFANSWGPVQNTQCHPAYLWWFINTQYRVGLPSELDKLGKNKTDDLFFWLQLNYTLSNCSKTKPI